MPTIVFWGWELAPDLPPAKAAHAPREILSHDPCTYCGARGVLTADHIRTGYLYRDDSWENLTAACQTCNSRKSSRSLFSFMLGVPVGRHVRAGREVGW